MADIVSELTARTDSGHLLADGGQKRIARELQNLADSLYAYRPFQAQSFWVRGLGYWRGKAAYAPKGIYIHGPVGRGKSMMLDLFYACAPTEKKCRLHFYAFMAEIHRRRQIFAHKPDPLPKVAKSIAKDTWLLCFDEFQVENIADAMIMERLFRALFQLGVVIVATSNHPPARLYAEGLHRARFLPFIDLLGEKLTIISLDGSTDYRHQSLKKEALYHTPLTPQTRQHLDDLFGQLAENQPLQTTCLRVEGRTLSVPSAGEIARFDFDTLCNQALGAADYTAIAHSFRILMLENIPQLTADHKEAARRFVTLIDILYEYRIGFICSATTQPEHLFGKQATGFSRTISRLEAMRRTDYWQHLAEKC